MSQVEWLKRFLKERGLRFPDERPLYAYRCSEQEYASLRRMVREMLRGEASNLHYHRFEEIFCLFAAETWQRCYAGGPWSYDIIFSALGVGVPPQQSIRLWIEVGLGRWRRKIIESQGGVRQYLLSLGCEGGIPGRLLAQAGSRLASYFRDLLTEASRSSSVDVEQLARRKMYLLPVSLRHGVIYELSAQLVSAINALQRHVRDATDPIQALDAADPQWRDVLPLPLGNDAVEVLLGNLVRHAQALRATSSAPVHWRRRLTGEGAESTLAAELTLPDYISTQQLAGWLGIEDIPRRLRLSLSVEEDTYGVALLSWVSRRDGEPVWRCEATSHRGVCLVGRAATQPSDLVASYGEREAPVEIPGDQGLDELPWVFRDPSDVGRRLLIGEGSIRTRQPSVLVAVAEGEHIEPLGDKSLIEEFGFMARTRRRVVRVRGGARVATALGDAFIIRCGAEQDRTGDYRLTGRQLTGLLRGPVYLGMPSLLQVDEAGRTHPETSVRIQWTPVGDGQQWRDDPEGCMGHVWVRGVDREDDGVLFRRRVDVVPPRCRLSLRVGVPGESGYIDLWGVEGATATVANPVQVQVRREHDRLRLTLPDEAPGDLDSISLTLDWPDHTPVELLLPVPRRGGTFIYAGRPLARDTMVARGRLGACRAVARGPGNSHYSLDVDVRSPVLVDPDLSRLLWLRRPLRSCGDGLYEVPLHSLQEPLGELMAMVADVDVRARFALLDNGGHELNRIQVARYDLSLEPAREQRQVVLTATDLLSLGPDWEDRITLEIIRLWDLDQPPVPLARVPESNPPAWSVPTDLEQGPWWIVGRDAGWTRFRPLLWTVWQVDVNENVDNSHGEGTDSELVRCILESDRDVRRHRMDRLIGRLVHNVDDPDWERLLGYLRLTSEHPAHALEVIKCLVQHPEALVLLLLRASVTDEDVALAWVLEQEMPFAWWLIPAKQWWLAAQRHFAHLKKILAEVDGGDGIVENLFEDLQRRLADRAQWAEILCDWLGEDLFPGRAPKTMEWQILKANPQALRTAGFIETMRAELFKRIDPEDTWPEGPRVLEQARNLPQSMQFIQWGYRRSVLCAPFVAARIFLEASDCSQALTLELRRLRTFDGAWFDHGFAMAIGEGLAVAAGVQA